MNAKSKFTILLIIPKYAFLIAFFVLLSPILFSLTVINDLA